MIQISINGHETVSSYGASLINREVSTQNIESVVDWLDGNYSGIFLNQSYNYRSIRLTFLVNAANETSAYTKISRLTEDIKKSQIIFSDLTNIRFQCYLNSSTTPVRVQNGVFRVMYTLYNDWGVTPQGVTQNIEVSALNAKALKVIYKINWRPTVAYYSDCFDADDLEETIAEEEIYVPLTAADTTATSWDEFFLSIGIDLDGYKPVENNTSLGQITIAEEFSAAAATQWLQNTSEVIVHYDRFQADGFDDIPSTFTYPSLVWRETTNSTNRRFNVPITSTPAADLSIEVIGRYYQQDTSENGNGDMIHDFSLKSGNLHLALPTSSVDYPVFQTSSSSGKSVAIVTLEDIDDLPLRKYGIYTTNKGESPIAGYVDIVFNGVATDRREFGFYSMNDPTASISSVVIGGGKYIDITRVKVYNKDELLRDCVVINGHLKNCFYNDYDAGLYDMVNMQFIKWTDNNGSGSEPTTYMPLPEGYTPPAVYYTATIVNGTGDGQYQAGDTVNIIADSPQTGYIFAGWTVTGGAVLADSTATSTSFVMPASNVTVTATYEEDPNATILLYQKDMDLFDGTDMRNVIANETVMGSGGFDITDTSDGIPHIYDSDATGGEFLLVVSKPGVTPTNITKTGTGNTEFTMGAGYTDKWGRKVVPYTRASGKTSTRSITFTVTLDNGQTVSGSIIFTQY